MKNEAISIEYKINTPVSASQFIDLLCKSSLGERRPINDQECIGHLEKPRTSQTTLIFTHSKAQ